VVLPIVVDVCLINKIFGLLVDSATQTRHLVVSLSSNLAHAEHPRDAGANVVHPAPGKALPTVQYQIDDVHRRIRNILKACPATSWSLEESRTVLDAVASIFRSRQAGADVVDLTARRALCEPVPEFDEQFGI